MAIEFLGEGFRDMGDGRFISADGKRQVRIGDTDILGLHGDGPHINFEHLIPGTRGRTIPSSNMHIYLID